MAIFGIADLHLALGSDKPMDIFEGWCGYVQLLEKNWRANVQTKDTVVIAGDISWAIKIKEGRDDFAFLNSLPGTKILLKGNHDYWWSTVKKMTDFFAENRFDSIKFLHNSAIKTENACICGTRGWIYNSQNEQDKKICAREAWHLRLSLESTKNLTQEKIVFFHYPPVYGAIEAKEIIEILKEYGVKRCFYGHVHGKLASRRAIIGQHKGIDMRFISCDHLGFKPLLICK
jgi:predicted phosphohydrolase